jgi:hypothetical protein
VAAGDYNIFGGLLGPQQYQQAMMQNQWTATTTTATIYPQYYGYQGIQGGYYPTMPPEQHEAALQSKKKETNVDWLDKRVAEMCVAL